MKILIKTTIIINNSRIRINHLKTNNNSNNNKYNN